MKVIHIGVFDRNIGDSIALDNLQRSFVKYVPGVEFHNQNLENFWNNRNNIQMCCDYFDQISSKFDAVLVGGGGLIEYYKDQQTNYKLPFNNEIISHCKIPIYFYGLGVNVFRGGVDYSYAAIKSLQETIDGSKAFTVRNDGSLSKLKNWIKVDTSKVRVVPDPGLLHLDRFGIQDKKTVSKGGIQPAFNHSQGINKNRFLSDDNLRFLRSTFSQYIYYPHTVRDFNQLGNTGVITSQEFESKYKFTKNLDVYLEKYKQVDYVVAMRGHGQMITIGLNIPGIYLSTQDKVRDFSIDNGFENYNVDILEPDWRDKLTEKVSLLTQPNSEYLKNWYSIRHKFVNDCHQTDKEFFKKYFNAV